MAIPTDITVRALAYGGKFIGSHVGFANIEIYNGSQLLASGLADQGLVSGTDGSGVVSFIMGQPYPWGYPIRAAEATAFTTQVQLSGPTVLTFVATSTVDPGVTTSVSRLVIPGTPLTGASAVVVVLQGLLAGLTEPTAATTITAGTATTITAQVRMMCGCLIDNLYWPAANFNVQALVNGAGCDNEAVTLAYNGDPSFFSAGYTFTAPGDYTITIIATEMNGNEGYAAPFTVTVNQTGG